MYMVHVATVAHHIVVKALCGGQVLEFLSDSEMPLSDDGCAVADRFHCLSYGGLVVWQA